MSKITNRILKTISVGKIEKIPRWKFIFKRILIWMTLFVAIILAAFAISMIIFQLVDVEWDLLHKIAPNPFFGVFKMVPYFWLIVASLLFIFVYFDFRNTKGGYRYSGLIVIGASLLISLLIGICIYSLKTPENANNLFLRIPVYKQLHMGREMMWNMPEKGILAGTVLKINGDKALILEDFNDRVWTVDISQTKGVKEMKILVGIKIRVIGVIEGPGKFIAEGIRFPKGGMVNWK